MATKKIRRTFTEASDITQAVRFLEEMMDEMGITLYWTHSGITFEHAGEEAVYLERDGLTETQSFPSAFETVLETMESHQHGPYEVEVDGD